MTLTLCCCGLIACTLEQQPVAGDTSTLGEDTPGYFVPAVRDQFAKLALRPDGLAFGPADSIPPTTCKHYQGIARTQGAGTPYFFITRSGNAAAPCFLGNDVPGTLLIVKMGSRDTTGERLRTNRLIKDWVPYERDADGETVLDPDGNPIPWTKPPDPRDSVIKYVRFDGRNGWPNYGHPGGMQLVDGVLAVSIEERYGADTDPSEAIAFIDVSDPENPVPLPKLLRLRVKTGAVGLTPVLNPYGPGKRYLLITTGGNSAELALYRSLATDGSADGPTDLKSPDLSWELLGTWSAEQLQAGFRAQVGCSPYPDPENPVPCEDAFVWPQADAVLGSGWPPRNQHQSLTFVREGSLTGDLYLIGARNTQPGGLGSDMLDLFKVNVDAYGKPGIDILIHERTTHVTSYPVNGQGDSADFAAASGSYVSPSGELIFYATPHTNNGPKELLPDGTPGNPTGRIVEYRHREIVRPNSPTLRPTLDVPEVFQVPEGGTTTLTGTGHQPITRAFLQLFEDTGLGLSLPGILDSDAWFLMDFDDYEKDNFDRLSTFDSTTGTNFNNNAESWRWFAPQGCNILVSDGSISQPGRGKLLIGDGLLHTRGDLSQIPADGDDNGTMDDMISSIQLRFGPTEPRCAFYYSAPINVDWDTDLDGTYETRGANPPFSAADLDGPTTVTVNARAQHSTDTTELGHSDPHAVAIEVVNVPPSVTDVALLDDLGFKVGVDVPFAFPFIKYTAQGAFTDPGKGDHQTAVFDFGDGTSVASANMDAFTDAFGGGTGQARHAHTYAATGTFSLRLNVTDDDGDTGTASTSIKVATPAEILAWIVSEIDARLASTTNSKIVSALQNARANLAASKGSTPQNGALAKIASGDWVAAIDKLTAAVTALQQAEAAGAGDLSKWKFYVALTGEAIGQRELLNAMARVPAPTAGQQLQFDRIRLALTTGHSALLMRQYTTALDSFKDATARALSLA